MHTEVPIAGVTLVQIKDLIRANIPLAPVPTVTEIRLHRATPQSGLGRFGEADREFTSPYWAHVWGGGLGLARHILDHPGTVKDLRVLDLGAGSGLVGIAAMKAGALHVLAADVDRYAIAAIQINAEANDVSVDTHHGDLTGGPPPRVDLVLAGDLFYDDALARRLVPFLDRCLDTGMTVLVGDPRRSFLPTERLSLLAEYPGPDFGASSLGLNAVFAFRRG